ncbi:hypothetical protein MIB92_06605 [Aestuariirhabdus sp. Z084]|uniref:hypothetical protein n=1 Tax=Aestuariirhabdus haliotis TaxID=2918751 RepID=UPI00201B379F|nr:hypothetical protein [Aestuariirhabdus haliotis]MCL6415314.1 hypothetical protein [Aestuariirhabdus haliotis]MCL6419574.1 hypothetical protein [Aestuariirhabdus haliotis]
MEFEWYVEVNEISYGQNAALVNLYHFLFKPKGYKDTKRHSLKFRDSSLAYFKEDSFFWHIEYSKISHLEWPENFDPASVFDNSYLVYIHTNDSDKYAFDCSLSSGCLKKVQEEVSNRRIV